MLTYHDQARPSPTPTTDPHPNNFSERHALVGEFMCNKLTGTQTLENNSSSGFDANVGVGFTGKIAEPRYRFYVEVRDHYAPHRNVITEIVRITFGVRNFACQS